jgi:predicted transposase/invertase (TIGR01784 family)
MPQPRSKGLNSPHDRFFRQAFSHPVAAREFFCAHLPARLVAAIDWRTLRRLPATFVDERLAGQSADLLFRARCRGRELYLYCLFEHQSRPDERLRLRLLSYMVQVWQDHSKEHGPGRKLPPLLPIVLHQGPRPWTYSTQFLNLVELPAGLRAELAPHQPCFEHWLVDLGRASLGEVRERMVTRLILGLMKAARAGRTRAWLEQELPFLARLMVQKSVAGLVITAMRYWYETSEDPVSTFNATVDTLRPETVKRRFMSLADQFRAQGRQEGRQEGKLLGAIQTVQRLLGLEVSPDAELEKLGPARLQSLLRRLEARAAKG